MSVAFNPFLKFSHILPDTFVALSHVFLFVCLFCFVVLWFWEGKYSIN